MDSLRDLHRAPVSAQPPAAPTQSAKESSNKLGIVLLVGGLGVFAISMGVLTFYAAGKIPAGYKLPTIICASIGAGGGLVLAVVGSLHQPGKKSKKENTEEVPSRPAPVQLQAHGSATTRSAVSSANNAQSPLPLHSQQQAQGSAPSSSAVRTPEVSLSQLQEEFDSTEPVDLRFERVYSSIVDAIRTRDYFAFMSAYPDARAVSTFDVNKPLDLGWGNVKQTLLHFAAYMRDLAAMDALMQGGANPNLRNAAGETPKDLYAANDGSSSLKDFILEGSTDKRGPLVSWDPFGPRGAYNNLGP